ncbi:hypothetical protein P175DRAFT_0534536 [Aspergillus ochraceoroseus IBT 24754]|uniref:PLD phosphodiesterase domain-containing protein n=1 Tax=Aspergillus ochraceoroseus IBT 24754 TaxID=1392256 RepID=A0A2T5LR52_9EURO|nr:uncharacterized protein P175DRAFT_0534536 [Aspergillus ochraceoroseus IBT 24754]PTU18765.1 hypothetical protein P175DRAFT_0534536 [Aspergillus ochraceoroseus IBT 24754]
MDSDSSEDSDLRAAIAASLNDAQGSGHDQPQNTSTDFVDLTGDTDDDDVIPVFPKSHSVIGSDTSHEASGNDDGEDEEDEDLKRAIALSLINSDGQGPSIGLDVKPSPPSDRVQKPPQSGVSGLDRKMMEQERLARLAKRKAEDSTAVDERETKQPRTGTESNPRKSTGDVSSSTLESHNSTKQSTQIRREPLPTPSIQFPEGVVKKTFAFGCRRLGDDIKIEEVFQKSDLELAVLSSFMWDMEWLFSKFNTRSTRFIMVMQAKDDATKRQYESETADMKNLRLCFPPMDGQVNCMHSKLMLLFHPGYLRVAVPTANLVPYDWGESVFLIDLPKKDDKPPGSEPSTHFYNELVHFLKSSTLHENIISKLGSFDFSKTERLAFVHSIGGSHSGTAWKRTGFCGLGRSIELLGLRTSNPVNLDFVTSSLGSLNAEFMKSIYLAAQGDDGATELVLRTAKSFPARSLSDPKRLIQGNTADEWTDRFRVYFPSQETVSRSKGGPQCAGTVCFQSRWYEGPKFPGHVLRDCESRRQGLLMHNKARYLDTSSLCCRGWAYIGSANLSESAWGHLVQDRSTKQPKLNCRNWECGVVIPVIEHNNTAQPTSDAEQDASSCTKKGKERATAGDESAGLLDMFQGIVPIPMRLPGQRYGPSRKPWYFMEM